MNLPLDPATAQAIAAYLAPFVPYLASGATKLAEKLGELGGEAAWHKAQELWAKIKTHPNPKLEAKANVVAADPADAAEVDSLLHTLLQILEQNPTLTAELAALLGQDQTVQQVIARNHSWIQRIVQKGPGRKTIEASDNSLISDVRQE